MRTPASPAAEQTARSLRRRRTTRLLVAAIATAAAAMLIPSGVTGAFWTSAASGAASTPGAGDWCATPDPASNPRAVRLSELPTFTGVDGVQVHMAAVPVANNEAWAGTAAGNRTLAVKLSSCATALSSFNLRVTAWSNPNNFGTVTTGNNALAWSSGSGISPSARLDMTQGYGAQLQRLARWGDIGATSGTVVSNQAARRYSWLISSPRSSGNVAGDPACGNRISCAPTMQEIDGNTATTVNTWVAAGSPAATFPPSYVYAAKTYALNRINNGTDWDAAPDGLAGSGNSAGTASATLLARSTGDAALRSVDGNQIQWVVLEWWGGTPPTSDLIAEIVLQ